MRVLSRDYAGLLLTNLRGMGYPDPVLVELYAQWRECRTAADNEDWYCRMEETLEMLQFGVWERYPGWWAKWRRKETRDG